MASVPLVGKVGVAGGNTTGDGVLVGSAEGVIDRIGGDVDVDDGAAARFER